MTEPLTVDQATMLQSLLIRFTQEFAAKIHEQKLTDLSLHISPDISYISSEHEKDITTGYLIRKSPACYQTLLKL